MHGLVSSDSDQVQAAGLCTHGYKPSNSLKYGTFFDQVDELLVSQGGLSSMNLFSLLVRELLAI
jgi:hypothetical protein